MKRYGAALLCVWCACVTCSWSAKAAVSAVPDQPVPVPVPDSATHKANGDLRENESNFLNNNLSRNSSGQVTLIDDKDGQAVPVPVPDSATHKANGDLRENESNFLYNNLSSNSSGQVTLINDDVPDQAVPVPVPDSATHKANGDLRESDSNFLHDILPPNYSGQVTLINDKDGQAVPGQDSASHKANGDLRENESNFLYNNLSLNSSGQVTLINNDVKSKSHVINESLSRHFTAALPSTVTQIDLLYGVTEVTEVSRSVTSEAVTAGESPTPADVTGVEDKSICDKVNGEMRYHEEEYSMVNNTHKISVIERHTTISVNITDIDEDTSFLIFQAHSQNRYLILSNETRPDKQCYTNSTDPGLVLCHDDKCSLKPRRVFVTNCHERAITVLFMVHNYANLDPIPGKYKSPCVAKPFLTVDPNVLTTEVTYQAAAMASWNPEDVVGALRYEVFLTYMYERDLSERKYWDTLIATSTLQGLKENGKSVDVRENNDTAEHMNVWLVSYSGVGAVVTVVVSYNGSNGTLYSSGVSYGCNFIDAEEYSCTKLVTTLAKLFCASLLFIGAILLFLGHRWLNFTMFLSGFLFSWCMLFLMFAQDTHSTINGLGWGTLVGAVLGGSLWLLAWHVFRRPFHSSLLIIIMAVLFVGMMATYFLRFAISPKTSNLSAFVVFPVFFAIVIIAYSIVDIKKVHIFSCTLLGSYAFIVPFAFYFGSSLTYILINVLGLVTVQHYRDTVGYPPFQVCDIILLCLWVVLFGAGMAYQLYRERASPPFHPPNLTSWNDFKKSANFVFDKIFACLPMDPDPGGIDVEERPAWLLRVVYTSKLAWQRLTCRGGDIPQSGYESFPRIRRLSQYNDQDSEASESRVAMVMSRIREWKGRVWHYFRRGEERLLQDNEDEEQQREEEQQEDESQLLEGTVSCCAFRNSQVVLDDSYTTTT